MLWYSMVCVASGFIISAGDAHAERFFNKNWNDGNEVHSPN